jgi:hypothetical protein
MIGSWPARSGDARQAAAKPPHGAPYARLAKQPDVNELDMPEWAELVLD